MTLLSNFLQIRKFKDNFFFVSEKIYNIYEDVNDLLQKQKPF